MQRKQTALSENMATQNRVVTCHPPERRDLGYPQLLDKSTYHTSNQ